MLQARPTPERVAIAVPQPLFLHSLDDFQAHISEHFEKLPTLEKGNRFAAFASQLVPLVPELSEFGPVTLSVKRSHDGGVDGSSSPLEDGRRLHMQAKLSIPSKEEFDSVISKFESYERSESRGPVQANMFEEQEKASPATFVIVTSQKLKGIISRYLESGMSSRAYYDQLKKERRFFVVDGEAMFGALHTAYGRSFGLPNELSLVSPAGWIEIGSVRLGVLAAPDLLALYRAHGDALFFENIRDWLGPTSGKVAPDQLTVNQEIAETIAKEPSRFLERNNGVTFKAAALSQEGGTLLLRDASIVNGCQTTMSLVTSTAPVDLCLVQVKVVESADAWDVAKAANYQNPVAKINLDIARYIRPQLVREAAAEAGIVLEDETASNAVDLLNALYGERVNYEEIRYLYIGLLSHSPNNIVDQLYTKLRTDLLSGFDSPADRKLLMDTMFRITVSTRAVISECLRLFGSEDYIGPFMRVLEAERPRYRMFLAILTLCALLRTNISERRNEPAEMARMRTFIAETRKLLVQEPDRFRDAYMKALTALATGARESADDDGKIRQILSSYVGRAFKQLYSTLVMQLEMDRKIDASRQPASA
jgi:hypothetical protein